MNFSYFHLLDIVSQVFLLCEQKNLFCNSDLLCSPFRKKVDYSVSVRTIQSTDKHTRNIHNRIILFSQINILEYY